MFLSDNAAGVHPSILSALMGANEGLAPGYGGDPYTQACVQKLHALFETECSVFLVATGTAANALALAAVCPGWGAVVCHRNAHIAQDEAGAPEFYTGGAKLLLIDGAHGKISADALSVELSRYSRAHVHGAQPFVVSLSQLSESGTAYSRDEIGAISAVCRAFGVKLHMDGARFANAFVDSGFSAAEATWKAGVDLLSFGATKNGAMGVDALICFDAEAAKVLPHVRKRAGHMLSKHRFLGAQMQAYLHDDLWLSLARRANQQARALEAALRGLGADILHSVDGNEVFARLSAPTEQRLRERGAQFYPWAPDGDGAFRFVASWRTEDADIAALTSP